MNISPQPKTCYAHISRKLIPSFFQFLCWFSEHETDISREFIRKEDGPLHGGECSKIQPRAGVCLSMHMVHGIKKEGQTSAYQDWLKPAGHIPENQKWSFTRKSKMEHSKSGSSPYALYVTWELPLPSSLALWSNPQATPPPTDPWRYQPSQYLVSFIGREPGRGMLSEGGLGCVLHCDSQYFRN